MCNMKKWHLCLRWRKLRLRDANLHAGVARSRALRSCLRLANFFRCNIMCNIKCNIMCNIMCLKLLMLCFCAMVRCLAVARVAELAPAALGCGRELGNVARHARR